MKIAHLVPYTTIYGENIVCVKCGYTQKISQTSNTHIFVDRESIWKKSAEYTWQKPDQMFKHVHLRSKRPDTTDTINCQDPLAKIMEVHES